MESAGGLNKHIVRALRLLMFTITASVFLMVVLMLWASGLLNTILKRPDNITVQQEPPSIPQYWQPPDMALVADKKKAEELKYGQDLIAHTAKYLGPEGSVSRISNGMNCQNCHLDAGTKTFGNNYAAVATGYPKFRARSGSVESVEKRINDCFERSLNGQALDSASREMQAMVAYINWLGSEVKQGETPKGSGLAKLTPLDRAADPEKGRLLYEANCVTCHGKNGEGIRQPDGTEYQFPPLWGEQSYNDGAGLYRLSNFAQFIHANMPLGASFDNPILSEEEAWDIAAYVNSLPRPEKDISRDWPKIGSKPFDHPFGPYADPFTETQHKYGPFQPIKDFYASKKQ